MLINKVAENIATSLVNDLKSGKLPKLGANEVDAMIIVHTKKHHFNSVQKEQLAKQTYLRIVQRC